MFNNVYFSSLVSLVLALYAATAAPKLPEPIAQLFENTLFKMVFMSLILYMSGRNLQMAIMISVAFTVTMIMLNEQRISEGFVDGIKENMMQSTFDKSH